MAPLAALRFEALGGECELYSKSDRPADLATVQAWVQAMHDRLTPKEARRHLLRPRVLIYASIMLVLITGFIVALTMRQPLKVDVIRDRGALAREVDGGKIENVYRLQLMNASEQPMRVTITA